MQSIRIRKAAINDAAKIIEHCKKAFAEGRNLLTTPEEYTMTVEKEVHWIEENNTKNNLILIAECGDNIVGMLNATRGSRKRVKHICHFGISIQEAYCNNGLGSRMIQILINWAKEDPEIEKVSLEVFAHNERAVHVYKKLGFIIEGKKEKHIKFEDGTYTDELYMGQQIK